MATPGRDGRGAGPLTGPELFVVMPVFVGPAELERRQRRFQAMLPASWDVRLVDLSQASSVPHGLDSEADIAASSEAVLAEIERIEERPRRWILPDCILDPGVGEARAAGRSRVVGVTALTSARLRELDSPFVAVTRNQPITNAYHRMLANLDIPNYRGAVSLELGFSDGHDGPATAEAIQRVVATQPEAKAGRTVVLNGCSAVDVPSDPSRAWRVIDPMPLARDELVTLIDEHVA
jgi:Asp/Glu/hydantoin racemase